MYYIVRVFLHQRLKLARNSLVNYFLSVFIHLRLFFREILRNLLQFIMNMLHSIFFIHQINDDKYLFEVISFAYKYTVKKFKVFFKNKFFMTNFFTICCHFLSTYLRIIETTKEIIKENLRNHKRYNLAFNTKNSVRLKVHKVHINKQIRKTFFLKLANLVSK